MPSALQSVLFVFAGAGVLIAQPPSYDPALGGTVTGIVLDANSRLRPVFGVPGASTLGPAIAIDAAIQVIAIAPYQDYVLGLQGDDRQLVISTLGASQPRLLATGIVSATLSPKGSSLLLLQQTGASAQVVSGLPSAAAVAWTADLSALPAPPSSIAISDDGTAVLAASPEGGNVSIFLVTAGGGPRIVASVGQLAGLSFLPGTTDALLGDAQAGLVQLLRGLSDSASLTLVADSVAPVDVASSHDGRRFYIASANPAGVIAVDRASGTQELIACACNPTALVRLGRSGVFRLTESSAGLFWLFDSAPTARRIVWVPPDAPLTLEGVQ